VPEIWSVTTLKLETSRVWEVSEHSTHLVSLVFRF